MNNYQERYKERHAGCLSARSGRVVRAIKQEKQRKHRRAEHFASNRRMSQETEDPIPGPSDAEIRLRRWRRQREMIKKIESQQKKSIFKVGIVHHKFYSPPITNRTVLKTEPCHVRCIYKVKHNPTPIKRVTRATLGRLQSKLASASTVRPSASISGIDQTGTKTAPKRLQATAQQPKCSIIPDNCSFKPPAGLAELPMFGRFAIPKAKVEKPSVERGVELDPKLMEDEPWPHASNPPVDIRNPKKRFDWKLLQTPCRGSSSIVLRALNLSLNDESTDEENSPLTAAKELNFTGVEELMDDDHVKVAGNTKGMEEIVESNAAEIAQTAKATEIENTTLPSSSTSAHPSFSLYTASSRGKEHRSVSVDVPTKGTAQYFKLILQSEIDRLTKLCRKWEATKNKPDLSENARYQISQAVGQTKLLIEEKFERFRSFVLDYETSKDEMIVRCEDLQDFWDKMYIEVKNCEARFLRLDRLEFIGWNEEQIAMTNKTVTKEKSDPEKPKISATGTAGSWIDAVQKDKTSQGEGLETDDVVIAIKDRVSKTSERGTPLSPKDRIFRKVISKSSPAKDRYRKRSTPKATPRKTQTSLLNKVQLSKAAKTARSPQITNKVNKTFQTPKVSLDDTFSYANSNQTPDKAILREFVDSLRSESCESRFKRDVDFYDDVFNEEDSVERNMKDYEDNSDNVIFDSIKNVTIRRAANRLDFEDDWFNESDDTDFAQSPTETRMIVVEPLEIPVITIVPETPLRTPLECTNSSRKSLERSSRHSNHTSISDPPINAAVNVVADDATRSQVDIANSSTKSKRKSLRLSQSVLEEPIEEGNEGEFTITTRVLRNRTITVVTPNKSDRRTDKSYTFDADYNSPNISTNENGDPLGVSWKAPNSAKREIVINLEADGNQIIKLKCSRKNVRCCAENRTSCVPKSEPQMTPYTRRSRKISLLANSPDSVIPPINGDLITFSP